MSVVCFAGGFAFESRMVLLPMKSSYMRFCEFLPASQKLEANHHQNYTHEIGVVETCLVVTT